MSKRQRGALVNDLTITQIQRIISELQEKGHVVKIEREQRAFFKCTLASTKDDKGNPKHPQCKITKFAPLPDGRQHKQLVQLIHQHKS